MMLRQVSNSPSMSIGIDLNSWTAMSHQNYIRFDMSRYKLYFTLCSLKSKPISWPSLFFASLQVATCHVPQKVIALFACPLQFLIDSNVSSLPADYSLVDLCRENIEHQVADATCMDLDDGSYDIVFSNWLLMYLDDFEVSNLAHDALAWVCAICSNSISTLDK